MSDTEIQRARAAAHDLIQVLSAYDDELRALAEDFPAVGPLREAIGAALAEACYWVSDQDAFDDHSHRTTH